MYVSLYACMYVSIFTCRYVNNQVSSAYIPISAYIHIFTYIHISTYTHSNTNAFKCTSIHSCQHTTHWGELAVETKGSACVGVISSGDSVQCHFFHRINVSLKQAPGPTTKVYFQIGVIKLHPCILIGVTKLHPCIKSLVPLRSLFVTSITAIRK